VDKNEGLVWDEQWVEATIYLFSHFFVEKCLVEQKSISSAEESHHIWLVEGELFSGALVALIWRVDEKENCSHLTCEFIENSTPWATSNLKRSIVQAKYDRVTTRRETLYQLIAFKKERGVDTLWCKILTIGCPHSRSASFKAGQSQTRKSCRIGSVCGAMHAECKVTPPLCVRGPIRRHCISLETCTINPLTSKRLLGPEQTLGFAMAIWLRIWKWQYIVARIKCMQNCQPRLGKVWLVSKHPLTLHVPLLSLLQSLSPWASASSTWQWRQSHCHPYQPYGWVHRSTTERLVEGLGMTCIEDMCL
jgi:hypothetical protein